MVLDAGPAPSPAAPGTHAIVVGGSMAGLLCARVLAGHFDRVTLFERDHFPDEAAFRAGVPQSRHLHVLLARGLRVLEDLFPGLESELIADGAETVHWHDDVLRLTPVGWARRFPQGLRLLSASRELFEWSVRRRLAALPNVRLADGQDVTGLLAGAGKTAVVGVTAQQRLARAAGGLSPAAAGGGGANRSQESTHLADLVVDAAGRDSRAPEWLTAFGCAPPREMRIDAGLGYASRYYARPAHPERDWKGMLLAALPDEPRGGGLLPIEGGRWLVTLFGYGGAHPPNDEAGFLQFARSLRSPAIYEAIKDAEALSPIRGYRRTANRWRRFDRLGHWPEQFLVVGDAVCAFNPVYGQGMTAAALAAAALDRCLSARRPRSAGDLIGLARQFQRAVAKSSAPIWLLATGEDLRYPGTTGATPNFATRAAQRYLNRVIAVSAENERVDVALVSVLHLLKPAATLLAPSILLPVVRGPRAAPVLQPPAAPAPLAPDPVAA